MKRNKIPDDMMFDNPEGSIVINIHGKEGRGMSDYSVKVQRKLSGQTTLLDYTRKHQMAGQVNETTG